MRKKINILIILLFMGSVFFSCKKILQTEPDDQLTLDESLKHKEGFISILSGIYADMGKSSLYGRELEFGMLDAMAGYWEIVDAHQYYPFYTFHFEEASAQKRIYDVWFGLYKLIRQCNQMLEHIENIKNDPDYNLLKGEIVALRAFYHFELLKLFGPVITNGGLNLPAIPYYTNTEKKKSRRKSSQEVLDLIESDLKTAKELMIKDPILTDGRKSKNTKESTSFLTKNRGWHMNYYAVSALMAKKLNWERKTKDAASEALDLISLMKQNQTIGLITDKELYPGGASVDIRLTSENIFGLYNNQMNNMLEGYFTGNQAVDKYLQTAYYPMLAELFGPNSNQDLRFRLWGPDYYLQKFLDRTTFDPDSATMDPTLYRETQIINVPELYFIATEGHIESDISLAIQLLNTFRSSRNLSPLKISGLNAPDLVRKYLLDEIRKEYIGEGVLFYYYKNFFHEIYRKEGVIYPDIKKFVLPIPKEEEIY